MAIEFGIAAVPGRELSAADFADPSARALAALDAVASIGSDEEREETVRHLMEAIAAERRAEGRPF